MRFYGGMTWDAVMKLQLRVFWSLNKQVTRLRAEEDTRALRLLQASQSGEACQKVHEALVTEIGKIIQERPLPATLNLDGFEELRKLEARTKLG